MVRGRMDPTYTKIALLIDASNAMRGHRDAVVEGFNAFLREQQAAGIARASLTVVFFNTAPEAIIRDVPLEDVTPLRKGEYHPQGGRDLLSGLGALIQGVGYRMNLLPQHHQPVRVMVGILSGGPSLRTNGDYNAQRITELVHHQETNYFWEFRHFSAGEDVLESASSLGIRAKHAFAFDLDPTGVQSAFAALSDETLAVRRLSTDENAKTAF